MNKNKTTKLLLLAGVFGVCLLIGYTSVRSGRRHDKTSEETPSEVGMASNAKAINTKGGACEGSKSSPEKANAQQVRNEGKEIQDNSMQENASEQPIVLKATAPRLNGAAYSFRASCTGVTDMAVCHYELWGKGRKVADSKDGRFDNIPGVPGGTYKLCLVGAGNTNLATITVPGFIDTDTSSAETQPGKQAKALITKEEFERRMLNPNDNTLQMARKAKAKKVLLAPTFKLAVVNMRSDERQMPTDIQGVRDKMHFDIWKSAKVIDVTYDEQTGQVTQATIEPVY